jgi:hypothetical protein
MGLPGLIGSQVPDGPDAVWVMLKEIKAQAQQVQAQIGSAQALITLATQQNALNTAQIALAANQVVPDAASTSVGSFNTTASQGTIATLTFTVPTGYTRAVLSGFGSTTSTNFSGTQRILYTRIVLASSSGPEENIYVQDFNTSPYADTVGNVSCFHAFIATGLTGGSSVSVSLTTRSSAGTFGTNALNNATLTGSVLYLK